MSLETAIVEHAISAIEKWVEAVEGGVTRVAVPDPCQCIQELIDGFHHEKAIEYRERRNLRQCLEIGRDAEGGSSGHLQEVQCAM